MPVLIGQAPDAGFDEPLQLLRDCHRRIEKFLAVLIRVVDESRGGTLDASHREALEAALRYFRNAAPRHTRDEEESLFPRLKRVDDSRAEHVMRRIDALEDDHVRADASHARIDILGRRWLRDDALSPAMCTELRRLLGELRDTYRRHITEEDDVIFPLAGEVLDDAQLIQIGREMAQRRGIDPDRSAPRCRHAGNRKPSDGSTTPSPEGASP